MTLIKPFGDILKEALKGDASVKTKMELETIYIDAKYFMELLEGIKEAEVKNRLLNCLLISRHFMMILEKKVIDFTDYTALKKSVEEKE